MSPNSLLPFSLFLSSFLPLSLLPSFSLSPYRDPVRLPTSNMILDRSTIAQHLLNDETGNPIFFTVFSALFNNVMMPSTYS
jgi:U-box domain